MGEASDLWKRSSAGAVTQESSFHQGCGMLPCPVLLLPASVAEYQQGLHPLLTGLTSHGACTSEKPGAEAVAEAAGAAVEEGDSRGSAGVGRASPCSSGSAC